RYSRCRYGSDAAIRTNSDPHDCGFTGRKRADGDCADIQRGCRHDNIGQPLALHILLEVMVELLEVAECGSGGINRLLPLLNELHVSIEFAVAARLKIQIVREKPAAIIESFARIVV